MTGRFKFSCGGCHFPDITGMFYCSPRAATDCWRVFRGGKRLFPASVPGTVRSWPGTGTWCQWNPGFQELLLMGKCGHVPEPLLSLHGTFSQLDSHLAQMKKPRLGQEVTCPLSSCVLLGRSLSLFELGCHSP